VTSSTLPVLGDGDTTTGDGVAVGGAEVGDGVAGGGVPAPPEGTGNGPAAAVHPAAKSAARQAARGSAGGRDNRILGAATTEGREA
jgi:hypothetical protein